MGCSQRKSEGRGPHPEEGSGAEWTVEPTTACAAVQRAGRCQTPLVLPSTGGPPTCRLSAHGGGGGGGSSGLRKTCWPRLRNWTTAMRMWCSTSTILAVARPPAGPAAELGQRVRDSFTGSARLSALAPPRPAHSPPPGRPSPAYLRATLDSTSQRVLSLGPHQSPPPGPHLPSLSALKAPSSSASRIPAKYRLAAAAPSSGPLPLLSLPLRRRHSEPLSCLITCSPRAAEKVPEPGQSPKAENGESGGRGAGKGPPTQIEEPRACSSSR